MRGTLVRVQVERVPAKTRPPKVLWLWRQGPRSPDLAVLWRAYGRRFDCEHPIRFATQTLGWATPRVRHPQQAERWTWLVLAATPSCAWPRRSSLTSGCPGNGPSPPGG